MRKKGVGSTITVIMAFAIGLIVLVVLISIFSGRVSIFNRGVDDAPSGLFECVCKVPGKGNSCAVSNPDSSVFKEGQLPDKCDVTWDDCDATCWVKR
jgi:hypothetical protein